VTSHATTVTKKDITHALVQTKLEADHSKDKITITMIIEEMIDSLETRILKPYAMFAKTQDILPESAQIKPKTKLGKEKIEEVMPMRVQEDVNQEGKLAM
jgi:hypothetical protein